MERIDLLAQVASLYYEDGLTQAEIARQVDASRSTISRLLQEAREAGIVEITIHYPWKTDPKLEKRLEERFQLRKALVLAARGRVYSEVLRGLGVLAARYIDRALTQDSTLGISWGTAVHSTAQALRPKRRLPITVVQMIGAVGIGDPLIDGPDLARLMADIYRGEYRYLHAPLVVENGQVRQGLLQEPRIQETLSLARKVDIALGRRFDRIDSVPDLGSEPGQGQQRIFGRLPLCLNHDVEGNAGWKLDRLVGNNDLSIIVCSQANHEQTSIWSYHTRSEAQLPGMWVPGSAGRMGAVPWASRSHDPGQIDFI